MTAPDDVRARFEAWLAREIAENGSVEFGADYRHWAEKGYRAAHADRDAEVRELVEADRAYDEAKAAWREAQINSDTEAGSRSAAQRAWQKLCKAAKRRSAALAKFHPAHREKP